MWSSWTCVRRSLKLYDALPPGDVSSVCLLCVSPPAAAAAAAAVERRFAGRHDGRQAAALKAPHPPWPPPGRPANHKGALNTIIHKYIHITTACGHQNICTRLNVSWWGAGVENLTALDCLLPVILLTQVELTLHWPLIKASIYWPCIHGSPEHMLVKCQNTFFFSICVMHENVFLELCSPE